MAKSAKHGPVARKTLAGRKGTAPKAKKGVEPKITKADLDSLRKPLEDAKYRVENRGALWGAP